jgi:hypothetical protein
MQAKSTEPVAFQPDVSAPSHHSQAGLSHISKPTTLSLPLHQSSQHAVDKECPSGKIGVGMGECDHVPSFRAIEK